MPGAQAVLEQLSARFEIFIATQAMAVPNSLGSKYRWLQRHFPSSRPRNTSSAATIHPPRRLSHRRPAQEPSPLPRPGPALHRAHNLTATGFLRVDNWQQVADYFATKPG